MARPIDTDKERLPLMEVDFTKIITKTKHDKKMKSTTKNKLLRAYTLLYIFGARISEIVDFTLEDMDFIFKNKYIILGELEDSNGDIKNTKTNTKRRLKVNDKMMRMLQELDYSDCTNAIFYKPKSDKPMKFGGFTTLVNNYLSKQLNPLYTSHSFRAGYITRGLEATGNPKTIQKLVGHKVLLTTLNYAGTTEKQMDDALDKMF